MGRVIPARFAVIPVRFTQQELELIRDARQQMNSADYIREAALDAAARGRHYKKVTDAYADLV